ncbi:MAG: N-acetyltransferase [Clostridia bacterium]|nr:N-acetyltransferase [Clostridia bacterium]
MSEKAPGIITLTCDNMDKEHICCAISDKKCQKGVAMKKAWMKDRMKEGLVFKRLDARGKVFIEYIPTENAWAPIEAPGYMYINCFWVSGGFKGQGIGTQLFNECEADSKGMNGIVVLSGKKKRPFLSDKDFFMKKGFEVCDHAEPYFELLVKRFNKDAPMPRFRDNVKKQDLNCKEGVTVIYSSQCPFTDYYVEEVIHTAKAHGIKAEAIKLETREEAQNGPSPFTTHSVFYNGKFLTHEVLNKPRFEKLLNL